MTDHFSSLWPRLTHDSQHDDGDISTVYGDDNPSVSGMFGELILIKYYDFLLCPVTRVVPHRHVAGHAGSHG